MQTMIVTNQPHSWAFAEPYAKVMDSIEYLTNKSLNNGDPFRIINLNTSYKYQSLGYYVSLLAEARLHKVFPSITTIQDLKNPMLAKIISMEIDDDIQEHLKAIKSTDFMLSIYFGKNIAKKYDRLCQQLHKLFPAPLFRVYFHFNKKWQIKHISPIAITDLPVEHQDYLIAFAKTYFAKRRFHAAKLTTKPYDLAILINPEEKVPPSNKAAIQRFVAAAETIGFDVELITKEDFKSIPEYDALFIRETTSVNHHTYRFARRAAAEGLIVMDDPVSILKCSNKVYLCEYLQKYKIPTPKTFIFTKKMKNEFIKEISYPCVIKLPDSCFSLNVIKVDNEVELKKALTDFFVELELVLIQEFMPTAYDWRIGVLDRKPLFACRYYMAKDHWQVNNWQSIQHRSGDHDCVPLAEVPATVLNIALKATHWIGDGLYGVDIKQQGNQVYVIEINDNPNIDYKIEDTLLGDQLYEQIMLSFLRRTKKKHGYE